MTSEERNIPTHEDECTAFLADLEEIGALVPREKQDAPLSSDVADEADEAELVIGGTCVNCLAARVNNSELPAHFEAAEEAAESELFDAAMCLYAFEGLIATNFERGDPLDQVVSDGLKICQGWVCAAERRLRLAKAANESLTSSDEHGF
ncbi:hypothetical protein [Pseudooceanicola spongiae]|uniref:Uncharacterized protein n=1 Tax=Pseudooceanicola spongiae TaxID=2613965 RepID=A0A7L9WT82_9RHOB|nr:hypothetical protein [Pseudooceanicola spongiae]QOL82656.1 hypothetical protein F3W81_18625 [Pseudooceanicola spongiae]